MKKQNKLLIKYNIILLKLKKQKISYLLNDNEVSLILSNDIYEVILVTKLCFLLYTMYTVQCFHWN